MGTRLFRTAFAVSLAALMTQPSLAQEHVYEAGQVWSYETAPEDEGSLILIQEVDQIGPEDDPMIVYHISMIGIRVESEGQEAIIPLPHAPVSRGTLDESVKEQVKTAATFPDYREGKAIWAENHGGVFTISLAELADVIRQSISERP